MAHPTIVAEDTFRLFMKQWHNGLQPMIDMKTEVDGAITIALEVTSLPQQLNYFPRKSGQSSRQRRQEKCAHTAKSNSAVNAALINCAPEHSDSMMLTVE